MKSLVAQHLILAACVLTTAACGLAERQTPSTEAGGHSGHDHDDDDHGPPGEVRLAPAIAAREGLTTARATRNSALDELELPAEVHLDQDRVAHISSPIDGQLSAIQVGIGDLVNAGQLMAELRSVELGNARAELSRAQAIRGVAQRNLERQQTLRVEGINATRTLHEAELAEEEARANLQAARTRLEVLGGNSGGRNATLQITSPLQGQVLDRHATQGENVGSSDVLFVVADLSEVWVIGQASESQIGRLVPGLRARLELNAYGGRSWEGQVDYIGAVLDERTRTLPVRVRLENPDGLLHPGLYGRLILSLGPDTGEITVPRDALVEIAGETLIFLPGDDSGADTSLWVSRPVRTGAERGGRVTILEGLSEGEEYVNAGAFLLKSEMLRDSLGDGHAH